MWNRSETKVNITFIRHGKTRLNELHKYVGVTDESLSSLGASQIKEYVLEGKYPEAALLFVSPMKRCKETARLIYGDMSSIEIGEFREMDFGEFEALGYEDLKGDLRYQRFIDTNGEYPFPGGETKAHFIERCLRGYERMLDIIYAYAKEHELRDINVTALVHGGTIMAIESTIMNKDYYSCQVKNGDLVGWSIT